jgi:LysM repeat protein
MKTKRAVVLLCAIIACFIHLSAHDHIILRNGQEYDAKLYQITDEKIVFDYINGSSSKRQEVASSDTYMVYIEKQGNVYLNTDGKRRTGESKRVDAKKYDAIYLINGAEIGALNIKISDSEISYTTGVNTGFFSKGNLKESTINKSEVFMIRYKSGMVDIITPIDKPQPAIVEPQQTAPEPQFVVVFHEVKKEDTLEKVAKEYNVSIENLREWNDISQKTKSTSLLTSGMQLMIYQPKK